MTITHKSGTHATDAATDAMDARDPTGARDPADQAATGGRAPAGDGLGAAGAQLSTQPADTLHSAPGLGLLGWLRWMWRQLTSMRVALVLLFLLSLAAIPGSLIPQHTDDLKVDAFRAKHPGISPLYDRLGLFHVYSSPWFAAIYILLFVSLAGCIIPRSWQFVGQLRARPPAAPHNLTRLPAYSTWRTDATPEEVARAADAALRGRRFRTGVTGTSVAGEKGYLREFGNLVFHIALFGLLIAFAVTSLNKAEGGKLIVEGDGFSNNLTQYDDFSGGTLYGADDLQPFGFSLDSFSQSYATSGPERGTALTFRANIHYWNGADGKPVKGAVSVNHPLSIGGEKVYLISHGYAPMVTVRDGRGEVAFQGPVPFLPQDGNLTSSGVIKAPGAVGKDGKPDDLGFQGTFAPTFTIDKVRGPHSAFPTLENPALFLNAFHGDLGLDSGIPQNVYQLETRKMTQYKNADGGLLRDVLVPGATMDLPGGGSLTFDGVKTWASFTISHQSGNEAALVSGVAAILGLAGSLFIQRRRVWVRAVPGPGGDTLVEMGGLGRSESARIAGELGDIALQLQPDAPAKPDQPEAAPEAEASPEAGAGSEAEASSEPEAASEAPSEPGAASEAEAASGASTEAPSGPGPEPQAEASPEPETSPEPGAPADPTPRPDDEGARA